MDSKVTRFLALAATAAEAGSGIGFGTLLLAGGLYVAANPELRPPRLPSRRPARWVLPTVGAIWLLATVGTVGISHVTGATSANADGPARGGRAVHRCAGLGLAGLAFPGAAAIAFEAARRRAAAKSPSVPAHTIIVLGCALKNDKPSELLVRRLRRAVAACDDSTETIICSGGFGSEAVTDATCSEAAAMVEWLAAHARGVVKRDESGACPGIELLEEDRSTNTSENLEFAVTLIAAHALAGEDALTAGTVVVTSDFHVPRVAKLLRERGLSNWSVVGADTPVRYWATSVLREFFAQFLLWVPGGNGRILRISRVAGGRRH